MNAAPASVLAAFLFVAAPSGALAQAPAAPADTLQDLRSALTACWKAPAGSMGSEITLRFSLTHKGELRGLPMITYSKLTGSRDDQERFAIAALAALLNCTPVRLTDSLGRIASQRMLHVRLISGPKALRI